MPSNWSPAPGGGTPLQYRQPQKQMCGGSAPRNTHHSTTLPWHNLEPYGQAHCILTLRLISSFYLTKVKRRWIERLESSKGKFHYVKRKDGESCRKIFTPIFWKRTVNSWGQCQCSVQVSTRGIYLQNRNRKYKEKDCRDGRMINLKKEKGVRIKMWGRKSGWIWA